MGSADPRPGRRGLRRGLAALVLAGSCGLAAAAGAAGAAAATGAETGTATGTATAAGPASQAGSQAASQAARAPYRLLAGDTVEIRYMGAGDPVTARVDLDGRVRLVDIGGIEVAGLTLDETETAIEAALAEAGLFVDPRASVSILSYAPVVVAGDVMSPGRFDYLPQMTVATALGLSGGSHAAGISSLELSRARAEVKGQLQSLNLEISEAAAEITRLEAQLADAAPGPLQMAADLRAQIPAPDPARLDRLLASEVRILDNARSRAADMLGLWDREIETLQQQDDLYAKRIRVQEEIVANAAEDLANAQKLKDRGLQTAAAMSRAEQLDADARARALELESAQIAVTRAIAESRRQRTQFLHAKREDALAALRAARARLDDASLRYGRALEQQAILSGGNMASLLASETLEVQFSLQSPRPGRPGDAPITPETPLLPGDTLLVRVGVARLQGG